MRVLVVVLAGILSLVVAVRSQQSHVYCGRNLALTLAMLCERGLLVKRGEPYVAAGRWPWLQPQRARGLQRGKRQVVAECCDKPCSLDELLSYCAD